ncbi:MAG: FAD:protein FMN transferase [Acidimicrobiales bacterium]
MTTKLDPITFPALGTTATLVVVDRDAVDGARRQVDREIDAVDASCSRFRLDSELTRLNASPGRPVRVSSVLLDALEVALRAARLSGGRVDPTVGSALVVLGYDRDFASVPADGPPLRVSVGPVPGWHQVRIDRRAGTVTVPRGVALDLGATAKALCADRAARAASKATGSGVVFSLGGDVAVAGPPPAAGWSVRVTDDHAGAPDDAGQTVVVTAGGLATSGTTVRRWERGGDALHHVIDPSTGWPARGPWRTVSVAAGCCVDANIASTAAVILGGDAEMWLTAHQLPARLVGHDGRVALVGDWPAERDEQCSG